MFIFCRCYRDTARLVWNCHFQKFNGSARLAQFGRVLGRQCKEGVYRDARQIGNTHIACNEAMH